MSTITTAAPTLPGRRRQLIRSWGLGWLGLALAAAVWQLVAAAAHSSIFPGFAASAGAAWRLLTGPVLTSDLLPSVGRTLLGFAISAVLGVAIGVGIGWSRRAREWTSAVFDFLRSLPTPLLIPAALALLGIGGRMVVAVIVTAAIWPVLINTANATASLEPILLDTARILELRRGALLRHVVIPAISPQVFAGLRVAISVSLAVMVVAEILGGGSGIGYFIASAQQSFRITDSFAGVLLLCLLGWLFDTVFLLAERRLLSWQRGTIGGESS